MSFPASRLQQHMWFGEQLDGNPVGHLIPQFLLIEGPLDVPALDRALATIVARHEILRTSLQAVNGELTCLPRPPDAFALAVADHSGCTPGSAEFQDLVRAEAATPLDVHNGLAFRARLIRLAGSSWLLSMTLHHAAFDDWSRHILYDELEHLYDSFNAGREQALPAVELTYRELVAIRDQSLEQEQSRLLGYWRPRLADLSPFEITPERGRPPARTGRGAAVSFRMPADTAARLSAIGREADASTAMACFAAVQILLRRYSGRDDITMGTTWAERESPGSQSVIGPLINMLVLRGDVSGDPSFRDMVQRMSEVMLDAFEHSAAPFWWLVDQLGVPRDPSRTPLFQVLVGYGSGTRHAPRLSGLRVTEVPVPWTTSRRDLSFWFEDCADGTIDCEVAWDTSLYSTQAMTRMAGHLQALLEDVSRRPYARLSETALLPAAEHQRLVRDLAAGPLSPPCAQTMHEMFERQASRTPDSVAVVNHDGRMISYRQLDESANQLAWLLRARGVGPEALVGIWAERSIELVVAMLAVLKAGGAFVPLDTDYPAGRLSLMLADSQPLVVLAQGRLRNRPDAWQPGPYVALIDLDDRGVWGSYPVTAPPPLATADNAAYMIYTSGSTGRPKGVINAHRGIVNRLQWMRRMFPLEVEAGVLQKTPISFDVSLWEFFWPLWTGARLIMARPGGHRDVEYLRDRVAEANVTELQLVPSVLAAFLSLPGIERCTSLRRVFCSGEALPLASVTEFLRRLPGVELHNMYGPTEAAIEVSWWHCALPAVEGRTTIPIGAPIDNVRLYVLDEWASPVPAGVAGELCIAGAAVARGYHAQPGLTADRFAPDPFSPVPGARMYRTGDLARWDESAGVIEFLGRVDHQVKLNGVRVEPGEIEQCLRAHEGVTDAVVLAAEQSGKLQLVAYVTGTADVTRLRQALQRALPTVMVPSVIMPLERLPLTPSGKLDRRALPMPAPREDSGFIPPRTPTEQAIAQIWAEVLDLPEISVEDDFFSLGGHSLLLMRVANRTRDHFDRDIPLSALLARPTVAGTAAALDSEMG